MSRFLNIEEQEQLAQVKHFWRDNGKYIIAVLVIAVLIYSAFTYYNRYMRSHAQSAAQLYDSFASALVNNDVKQAQQLGGQLKTDYAKTIYAQNAALNLAKVYMDSKQAPQAQPELEWVAQQNFNEVYRATAQYRLAVIAFDLGNNEQALTWLNAIVNPSANSLVLMLKGDVYLQQGNKEQAIKEYQAVYKQADAQLKQLMQLKLNKLGVAVATDNNLS